MSLKPILFCCFYAASAAFHYSPTYPPCCHCIAIRAVLFLTPQQLTDAHIRRCFARCLILV